jgi:hypothetical protein
MLSLDDDLVRVGDQLQAAWSRDAGRARRHRRALLGACAAVLAIAGVALAADVFPAHVTPTSHPPAPAALMQMRAAFQPVAGPLEPWQKTLKLDFGKAVVVARITSRETGPLAVIVVPGARHRVCFDAARPDGSSFLAGCDMPLPSPGPGADRSIGITAGILDRFTGTDGVTHAPIMISIRNAPPYAARIDVRARDASTLPAVVSHGWLVFVNQRPGAAVLVRVYDASGKKLLSYYG